MSNKLLYFWWMFMVTMIICVNLCRPNTLHTFRRKRSIFNLAAEVNAIAPRNALSYIDYGNYCGPGGNGRSVDGIDQCCEVHDKCYGIRDDYECRDYFRNLLLIGYDWDLKNGQISCDQGQESCPRAICECDKALAECFARRDWSFNSKNKRWFGWI